MMFLIIHYPEQLNEFVLLRLKQCPEHSAFKTVAISVIPLKRIFHTHTQQNYNTSNLSECGQYDNWSLLNSHPWCVLARSLLVNDHLHLLQQFFLIYWQMPFILFAIFKIQISTFEVLTVAILKINVFWDAVPCSLVHHYQRTPSYTLKTEAAGCSETFLMIYQITQCHIPKD
jgi:hypothetical protein